MISVSAPDFCSTDSVLLVTVVVVVVFVAVIVVVVVLVVVVFVVVVVMVDVVVVEGGVGDLVVVACTVTFIVANTFLPLFLPPPQTYSSTSHLANKLMRNTRHSQRARSLIIQIVSIAIGDKRVSDAL